MIEREFIKTKIKNLRIRQRINDVVTKSAGCGNITIEKTPMGEKIIVDTVRPGIVIGRGSKVWGKVTFRKYPGSTISIDNNVYIISSPLRYSFNIYPLTKLQTLSKSAEIKIGKNVAFNSLTILARSTTISIGDGTLIGGNCQIFDTDGHQLWPADKRFNTPDFDGDRSVSIGKNVFVGLNVLIMKGVEIGDNSIIAAGSVVTRSIPKDCVAAGIPAKVISTH